LQEYSALFEGAGNNPGEKTLEDKFFEHEVSVKHCLNYRFPDRKTIPSPEGSYKYKIWCPMSSFSQRICSKFMQMPIIDWQLQQFYSIFLKDNESKKLKHLPNKELYYKVKIFNKADFHWGWQK
jgi:hypothetical protein